jgi:hypothetical protein
VGVNSIANGFKCVVPDPGLAKSCGALQITGVFGGGSQDPLAGVSSFSLPGFKCNKRSTNGRGSRKNALDYVIGRFNLPSARLNKPQGLDLR